MSHEAPGISNEWFTPPRIFDALGERFDMDVAAPDDRRFVHTPAAAFSTKANPLPWTGFVWMNPPFGDKNTKIEWLARFFKHGNGIALTPDRTCAAWFHFALDRADAALLTRGRPRFIRPNGEIPGSPGFNVTLWAAGARGERALFNAQKNGLGFVFQAGKEHALNLGTLA